MKPLPLDPSPLWVGGGSFVAIIEMLSDMITLMVKDPSGKLRVEVAHANVLGGPQCSFDLVGRQVCLIGILVGGTGIRICPVRQHLLG